jgi:hypothetical protein
LALTSPISGGHSVVVVSSRTHATEFSLVWSGGKPERKRPLNRSKLKWEDDIKIGCRETEWDGMEWIHLAQEGDKWRALLNKEVDISGLIECCEFLRCLFAFSVKTRI